MYMLGQVSFQDMPSASDTAPAAVVVADSGMSSIPGLAIVAGLALAVWLLMRRGRGGPSFFGRAFGDAPKRRRRNPKGRRRRRRNVLVWGG